MDADWESQQESLVRNAELLPPLDPGLKRRVLMQATVARKKAILLRRVAVAACVLLFVGTGSYGVLSLLDHNNTAPMADSKPSAQQDDDQLTDAAIDRLEKRSKVFPASMY